MSIPSIIKPNILLYLKKKGLSEYEFYKRSGITRGALKNRSGMSESNILRFLDFEPEINLQWLFSGSGKMLKNTHDKVSITEDSSEYYNNMNGQGFSDISSNNKEFIQSDDSMAPTLLRGDKLF